MPYLRNRTTKPYLWISAGLTLFWAVAAYAAYEKGGELWAAIALFFWCGPLCFAGVVHFYNIDNESNAVLRFIARLGNACLVLIGICLALSVALGLPIYWMYTGYIDQEYWQIALGAAWIIFLIYHERNLPA